MQFRAHDHAVAAAFLPAGPFTMMLSLHDQNVPESPDQGEQIT